MPKIKKGDIVGRKSYGKDIIFVVEEIINLKNNEIAILKGIDIRIKADSYIEDLEIVDKKIVEKKLELQNKRFEEILEKCNNKKMNRDNKIIYTGKILHLDGDRRYSEKSNMFYKKMGLKAIVKNIIESKQPLLISNLILKYNPDILVITRT